MINNRINRIVWMSLFLITLDLAVSYVLLYLCGDNEKLFKLTQLLAFASIGTIILIVKKMYSDVVVIDGIRYKLDIIKRYAEVRANNYSGKLVIPSTIKHRGLTYSVKTTENAAFENCNRLESITIPDSVINMNPYSVISTNPFWRECDALTSIKVTSGNPRFDSRNNCNAIIETETNMLFAGCKATCIPNSVATICDYAFAHIKGLTSITIPENVTSIGEGAFFRCTELTTVNILGKGVNINGFVFCECKNLKNVILHSVQVPIMQPDVFKDTPISEATLHVPAASIETYKMTAPWNQFKNIVAIE